MKDPEKPDRRQTTVSLEVFSPVWVLETAGYKRHPKGNGMIKVLGVSGNRFHAYPVDSRIDLHFDKVHADGHHSSILRPQVFEEVRRLVGIGNGSLTGEEIKKCARMSFYEHDMKFLLTKINKRPWWFFSRRLYKYLIFLIVDLKQ